MILLPIAWSLSRLTLPKAQDTPVIASYSLLHMCAFSTLAAAGQQFIPASTAVVLAYTTPIRVGLLAPFFPGRKGDALESPWDRDQHVRSWNHI